MATVAQWIEGARPRTLPNAVAPVLAGTGAAAWINVVGFVAMVFNLFFINLVTVGLHSYAGVG